MLASRLLRVQDCWLLWISPLPFRRSCTCCFSTDTVMKSFFLPVTYFSKKMFSSTDFVVNRNHVATIMPQVEIFRFFVRDLSGIAQHFCAVQQIFSSETEANRFHYNLATAKVHHQEYIRYWLLDEFVHLLLLLDRGPVDICLLQLLCSDSLSPIRTISNCLWHQDQHFSWKESLPNCLAFDPILHAMQLNSVRHSIQRKSNCRHTKSGLCAGFLWHTLVQIREILSLLLISSVQGPIKISWNFYF